MEYIAGHQYADRFGHCLMMSTDTAADAAVSEYYLKKAA